MYTSTIVEAKANPLFPVGFDVDRDFVETQDPSWLGYRITVYSYMAIKNKMEL